MTTTHEYRGYVFTVSYQAKEPAFVVDFPDIPEIITSGGTLAEAFANACEALDLHLEGLAAAADEAPPGRADAMKSSPPAPEYMFQTLRTTLSGGSLHSHEPRRVLPSISRPI